MPVPLLAPLAVNAGIQVGGALLARALGGKRNEFDLTTPAINEAQASLSDLESQQRRQQLQLESDLARVGSAGFTGAAARENLVNANATAGAGLRGSILDTLARARQQETMLNTEAANQERLQRIQGITNAAQSIGSGVGDILGQKRLIEDLGKLSSAQMPSVAATQAPAAPAMSFDSISQAYGAQRYFPVYGQLMDYSGMSRRIFDGLQQ